MKTIFAICLICIAACGSTEYEEPRSSSNDLKPATDINGPVKCDENGICTQLKELK